MKQSNSRVFRTLFNRQSSRENVILKWSSAPLHLPQWLQNNIESYWSRLSKEHIFNGKLARLKNFKVYENQVHLELQPTDYQTLLYSNAFTDEICRQGGKDILSRALGISAIVVSRDNFLLTIKRSARVGEYPNLFDVVGGHIDVPPDNSAPDIFNSMEQEIEEELGLAPHEVELALIGMIETTADFKPELVFTGRTDCSKDDILRKSQTASHKHEYYLIKSQPNTIDSVQESLYQPDKFSPSAYGCLSLYLNQCLRKHHIYERNE